jgi:hypothetical protein
MVAGSFSLWDRPSATVKRVVKLLIACSFREGYPVYFTQAGNSCRKFFKR